MSETKTTLEEEFAATKDTTRTSGADAREESDANVKATTTTSRAEASLSPARGGQSRSQPHRRSQSRATSADSHATAGACSTRCSSRGPPGDIPGRVQARLQWAQVRSPFQGPPLTASSSAKAIFEVASAGPPQRTSMNSTGASCSSRHRSSSASSRRLAPWCHTSGQTALAGTASPPPAIVRNLVNIPVLQGGQAVRCSPPAERQHMTGPPVVTPEQQPQQQPASRIAQGQPLAVSSVAPGNSRLAGSTPIMAGRKVPTRPSSPGRGAKGRNITPVLRSSASAAAPAAAPPQQVSAPSGGSLVSAPGGGSRWLVNTVF
eukprot:gnl/TRDRNA2_/TRDRNA2_171597_c0_seq5.p1 gnl/TRDRNA2_/TRDRNA2_171597_c0~~gnl/TRDRNA2_/TRDRNA2_171597_c0_seq5.p1  ORF type:complete len:319 (+),score=46.96 gnl/TRDRNA2_/TRDRNA2_171597_c0_seq5:1094-2050(+)